VFTFQLLKRGIRQQDLTLIEYGSDFMRLLQIRFPGARVLWMDAARLTAERIFDGAPVGAVISGLPLLNTSTRKMISILGGAFYQFTYGTRCPVPRPILDRLGLKATLVDRTLRNVPPAAVYRLTRRPQVRLVASNASTLQPQTENGSDRQTSRLCTIAAWIKDANRGCGSKGRDFSSGWNCTPMNHG
jgi:hypothetical protein